MQFPGFSSPVGSRPGEPSLLSSLLGTFLWLQTVQHILVPYEPLRYCAVFVLIVYLAINFSRTSMSARRIFFICMLLSGLLLLGGSNWRDLYSGFDFALTFMAFLPSISMVRMLFRVIPSLVSFGDSIREVPADNRTRVTLVLSNALGAIMSIGAFAAITPLFQGVENADERKQAGMVMMRGTALSMLWTPFTVGMGFASSNFPGVPLWKIMVVGFSLSAGAIALGLRHASKADFVTLLLIVRKLALPVAGSAAVLVAANSLTGMSSLALIILLVPPLCVLLVFTCASDRQKAVGAMTRTLWSDLGGMESEMLLFVGSISMGALLSSNAGFLYLLHHLGLATMPPPLLFPILAFGLVFCAVAGLHASIIGPLVVAIYAGLDGRLSPLAAVVLLLFGWSCASMLSVSSLGVAIVSRSFGVKLRDLVCGENLVFALKLAVALSIGFAVLDLAGLW